MQLIDPAARGGKNARAEEGGQGADNGVKKPCSARGRRVLLVEDEALVAMMIQDFLTESGHSVIGPISRASEAVEAARESDYDAAILDINLGDGMAYPVADILSARGIPFVFVTGYEADTIDDRFNRVPVLQKPIERQMLQRLFLPRPGVAAVARARACAAQSRKRGSPAFARAPTLLASHADRTAACHRR